MRTIETGLRFCIVVLVALSQSKTPRMIEPYALRRTREGKVLLVAVKRATRETRTYRMDRIQSIKVSNTPFKPAFKVELGDVGPVRIPDLSRAGTRDPMASRTFPPRGRAFRSTYGPTYVIKCVSCGREFKRQTMNTTLKHHKGRGGWQCPSLMGYFVRTE